MGKFTTYMFVMSGFFIVFYLLGLSDNNFTSGLLSLLFNPSDASGLLSSGGGLAVVAVLVTSVGAYGVSAFITRSYFSESLVMITLVPLLLAFLYDFVSILNVVSAVSVSLSLLVFAPMVVVYVLTVLEWWRGVTT